jgi:hypothetical protein
MSATPPLLRVRLALEVLIGERVHPAGAVIDVERERGLELIVRGHATPAAPEPDPPPAEPSGARPPARTRSSGPAR